MRVSLPISTAGRSPRAPSDFAERAPRRPAELEDEVGRDRRIADAAAHAVGAEVAALLRSDVVHCSVCRGLGDPGHGAIAFQTASASTVSRTSCTRKIRAPRTAAASAAAMLPASRSSTSRPVIAPSVALRDRPATTG